MNDDAAIAEIPGQKFVPVCAIGASAGGVTALQDLLRHVPADLGLAYVVIVHLSPDEPSSLDDVLSVRTRMPVLQVKDKTTLKPDTVYVIPPDRELVIEGDGVTARAFSQPRGHRAPIDQFFRSVAAARGDGIALILSGAGSDGSVGVRAVKEAGGVIMVQEPAEAAFPSMPQNAIATGDADFVAPLARLAERLAEVAQSKEAVRSLDMDGGANDLRRIVSFLRSRVGHDFSSYKRATVMRRVVRRMQVCRTDTFAKYADYLMSTPEEAKELLADLLISVTMFFRDPRAFEALERRAIKPLFDELDPDKDESIRVWVVGCATGEEAYGVAMLLNEEAMRRKMAVQIQIFATDLDDGALATAREGRFPKTIEADVSEERLTRFFIDEGTHYQVRKELRDSVLFATHSVIKEPPFMRLDLITCRNLLIYLERSLQTQLCSIFHYGLKPERYLFLGSAETADAATDLFAPVDREARIYCARPNVHRTLPILPQFAAPERLNGSDAAQPPRFERAELPAALHVAALERRAPASALVDRGHNVLHLSSNVGRFIVHPAGPVSHQLPAIVRPELRLDLGLALTRALDRDEPTLTHPAVVDFNGDRRRVVMQVVPAHEGEQALVFFLDGGSIPGRSEPEATADDQSEEVRRVNAELKAAQEALVASRRGHETAMQELRATNEELQSINEEYRSTAEELETSKEELQSINEELHTVNAELKSKLSSISVAHSDLQNLTGATEIGTLFLDADLRIKMFTPPIADLFNIARTDIGRTVTSFTHHLEYDRLEADARRVLKDLASIENEVRTRTGLWYAMRLRPYRTIEDRIDGVVVTFVDVTTRRKAEAVLQESETRQTFLLKLSDALRPLAKPADIQTHAARVLGEHLGVDGVLYWETELDDDQSLVSAGGYAKGPTTIPKRIRAGSFGTHVREAQIANRTFAVSDVKGDRALSETELAGYEAIGVRAFIAVPLVKEGAFVATLGVYDAHAHDWTNGEIALAEETAERTWAALERAHAEAKSRESEARFQQFAEASSDGLWIRNAEDLRFEFVSLAFQKVYGRDRDSLVDDENVGGWIDLIDPEDRELTLAMLKKVAAGERVQFEFRVERPDGETRWIQNTDFPLLDAEGKVQRIGGIAHDITEEKATAARMEVLVAELQHRTRNLLGVVRALMDQSLSEHATFEDLKESIHSRLGALGRVNGLLSRLKDGDRIPFDELIDVELTAVAGGNKDRQVTFEGPKGVRLRSATVQTLALAFHELATNAVKYGALSTSGGRLAVTWRSARETGKKRWLFIDWKETGVQVDLEASASSGGGYGRRLIEEALPYQLGAEVEYRLTAEGLVCSISLPVSEPR